MKKIAIAAVVVLSGCAQVEGLLDHPLVCELRAKLDLPCEVVAPKADEQK